MVSASMRRAAILSLLLLGCGDATGLLVEVTSDDLAVGADVDSLRFVATTASGTMVDRTFPISGDWPQSLTILPSDGANGEVTVTVYAIRAGTFVAQRAVRASFVNGETVGVRVLLSADCRGVSCPLGVDCQLGRCVGVPPTQDAGPGGVDAGPGMVDAGPGGVDAGPGAMDAGPGGVDAGRRDAGTDAGSDAGSDAGMLVPPLLYFTEYLEGTSFDKALEIVNEGLTDVDLSRCELRRYSNGSTMAFSIALTGTLARNDYFVICHSSISDPSRCDQMTASISHNGNDAYELLCDGSLQDSFGRVGEDPMSGAWEGGGLSTAESTLQRRCAIASGDTVSVDAFDPSTEWMGGTLSVATLGSRAECP